MGFYEVQEMSICKSWSIERYIGRREGDVVFDRCALVLAALTFLWEAIWNRKIYVQIYNPPLAPNNTYFEAFDWTEQAPDFVVTGNTWTTRHDSEANLWKP
jgi:hypothetical protein